jgi:plastocyanin
VRHALAVVLVIGVVAVPSALAAPRGANVVVVSAVKSGLRYTTKTLHAKAGRIEIVFHNPSMLPHNVRIESGENELGGTKTVTHGTTKAFVTLKPGTYHFYCSVPGHEDAGMSGNLVVR